MVRAAALIALLALSACGREPREREAREDTAAPSPTSTPAPVLAVLIVHWPTGQNDFSREYATMEGCQSARKVILSDAASRADMRYTVAKKFAGKGGGSSDPEPYAVPICIPA